MKTTDFTYLLGQPEKTTEKQTSELEVVLSEFPYFQSAGAIRLKKLYDQNSFRYNLELKKLASQTINRTVLFEFISSENLSQDVSYQLTKKTNKKQPYEIEVFAEIVSPEKKIEQSILNSIETSQTKNKSEALSDTNSKNQDVIDEKTEFSKTDQFSFVEWLQRTKTKPIVKPQSQTINEKLKKSEIIDRFIQANPKIVPSKVAPKNSVLTIKPLESSTLMTETLARVYLEQKKFQKAIEAYEILILKYPQKSLFFADQIEYIKQLEQNNI